jgi:hypothetical protein
VRAAGLKAAFAPWAGLFLGAAGWFLHQQAGSGANAWDCRIGGALTMVVLALVFGGLAVAGGVISWRARKPIGGPTAEVRRFSGLVGAATAGIFLLAIVFDTLASLIVPACVR